MNRLWQETLTHLEQTLSPQHFSTWIKPIRFQGMEKDLVMLEVPNRFFHDWIRDHYAQVIRDSLSQIGAVDYRLQLNIAPRQGASPSPHTPDPPRPVPAPSREISQREWNTTYNLNSKYTFDEFVSGSSNQFAFAAALAVANNPATTYNPLFIYGGVGLGKTHLINAVGNAILRRNSEMKVCYYTSEKFIERTYKFAPLCENG